MKATAARSWAASWNIDEIWQLPRHNRWPSTVYLLGPEDLRAFLWRSPQSEQRVRFWGRVREKKKKIIFFPRLMYKKNKQLSVCVLSGYEQRRSPSTTVTTGPWSFRGVCKNTHTAARLRLRRPSGGSLWPSLSLCKNRCSPMMCYVKFPEAWFKWLDILHASLVILQCIAPKSTWTPHEKQM